MVEFSFILPDRDFTGAGAYADVTLRFEGGAVRVPLNGRLFDEAPFEADPNADSDARVVQTESLRCCGGRIETLRYTDGWQHDAVLTAELIFDDGTAETVVFHTGSEESLYMDLSGDAPRFPDAAG